MEYNIVNVSSSLQVNEIYEKMNQLFVDQEHFPIKIIEKASKEFPGLINIAYDSDGIQNGHILFIPLNKTGYDNMLDPKHDESKLSENDIFDIKNDNFMYLFVYSIFSLRKRLTKELISSTVLALQEYSSLLDPESIIFTEVVTTEGERLAKRMSLEKYHSFNFNEETLHLYKSSIEQYILTFSSLKHIGLNN